MAQSCRNNQNANAQPSAPVAEAYPVFKAIVHNTTLRSEYPATLQGQQNIEIRPKIDGYIQKIYIGGGPTVRKGQWLFSISEPQYEQEVKSARAVINSAEADVNTAKLQVE